MVKDFVCGMTVDENTAIGTVYKGQKYYFCSEHCKHSFVADPEKYIKEATNDHRN